MIRIPNFQFKEYIMNEKISKEQFNKILNLVNEIQKICQEADTSSINMWLTRVSIQEEYNEYQN